MNKKIEDKNRNREERLTKTLKTVATLQLVQEVFLYKNRVKMLFCA